MIRRMFVIATLAIAGSVSAQMADAPAPTTPPPSTQPLRNLYQDAGYGIGYDLGKNIKDSKIAIDTDKIIEGLRDCLAGKESAVTAEQFQLAMTQVQMEMQAKQEQLAKEEGEKNLKAGTDFCSENAKKPGIVTTASGLQIETIKEGTGAAPKATDTVKVHYTGKTIDGKTFDSSVDRGEPVTFPLNGVIKGWTEGLQLMKVGGKAKLVIPPTIAYGAEGAGKTIPPNATLVFDVELLDIEKPEAAPTTQP